MSLSPAFVAAPVATPLAAPPRSTLTVELPAAELGASDPARSAGSMATLGCMAAVAGFAVAQQRSRRAERVGRKFFGQQESEEEKAVREAREAEEAEARRYAEFCAKRDALPLPNAVPFLGAPKYREFIFNVAGDSGFDPLSISRLPEDFEYQRRAELTHGRFAMLAAVGWPLAELYHSPIAATFGLENELAGAGRAPSVLNGGLVLFDSTGPTPLSFFFVSVAFMAYLIENRFEETFDPLNLKGFVPPAIGKTLMEGREWMAEAEIKHCRIAMVAITAYALEEFLLQSPVTKDTPYLFSGNF